MSAAAQVVLAQPVGLNDCAAVAAQRCRECRRVGGRVGRDGPDVGSACRQWSSGHPRRGTLVRHFMFGVGVVTPSHALAPAPRSRGMLDAATARALVATGGLASGNIVRLAPAGAAAIPIAAIAVAAQDDLDAAPDAQEQTGRNVQLHHQTEPVVLDGVVPARHTAAAPPSSARCRARRGHQASRQERAAAVPTFFSSARVVLRRPPRPLGPSGRPAGRPDGPPLIDQLLGSQYRELLPHEGCEPNPLPRHHIRAVPDQRSQVCTGIAFVLLSFSYQRVSSFIALQGRESSNAKNSA